MDVAVDGSRSAQTPNPRQKLEKLKQMSEAKAKENDRQDRPKEEEKVKEKVSEKEEKRREKGKDKEKAKDKPKEEKDRVPGISEFVWTLKRTHFEESNGF